MNAYANFGSIAGANGIIWYHADVRYATDAEIASGEIPNIQASVMAQAGAITDLEGRTESYLKLSTIAGQNVAEVMAGATRSEEHKSELQSIMRISYAVFCWKTKIKN